MVPNSIKSLYNQYLRITRSCQNKPFRYRKNFDKFEEDKYYIDMVKLDAFFKNHKHIDSELFFTAPFKVKKEFSPTPNYYLSRNAVSCYIAYCNKLDDESPDSKYHLDKIKEGIKHIYNYCKENNIEINQYLIHDKSYIPEWLLHLKYRQISPYNLFYFQGIKETIDSMENDIIELYIPHFFHKYIIYKRAFLNSKKAKNLVARGTLLCDNKLKHDKATTRQSETNK